ncbi:MAG: 1-deoxy-D-xylulose-5-phosphate reductoisomerase [Gammaproteobacteria bacterium]|nr:1-deoxy-D-xylulose-5-phosphate reductoisomerase [Gammaproteobacteria bacterium]MAY03160.1 1-deoxy-D-xylulose-5-phosphate reductoisomerase [Gammaproteobacteria bacterium]|tara:strand:+ start:38271 stop:39479 length:1209 start_codon:yes stop_codon:yes gene_type:complete
MTDTQSRQQITILGSTGSIGVNTLKVVAANPEDYEVFALSARSQVDVLFQQCMEFRPRLAVMVDAAAARELSNKLQAEGSNTRVMSGTAALQEIAAHESCDIVMAAIVGGAGLLSSLAAARAGKRILLANKEALVMAGDLFMQAVAEGGALLLPIDSEHNAIFQCLPIDSRGRFADTPEQGVEKIVLTASGGPFLGKSPDQLKQVTPAQACAHPNWAMGRKISVDSATLMNKALEFIEASILFSLPASRIEVLIHPESIVHSMVYYSDGSVLAQLGNPDMCTPIAYGLAWPQRIDSGVAALDLQGIGRLNFADVDKTCFPGLELGKQAAQNRGTAPVILNAANEAAVAAFLAGTLSFNEIPVIIGDTLNRLEVRSVSDIEEVLEADSEARKLAEKLINSRNS